MRQRRIWVLCPSFVDNKIFAEKTKMSAIIQGCKFDVKFQMPNIFWIARPHKQYSLPYFADWS